MNFLVFYLVKIYCTASKKRNELSNHLLSLYLLPIEQIKIKLTLPIADLKGAS